MLKKLFFGITLFASLVLTTTGLTVKAEETTEYKGYIKGSGVSSVKNKKSVDDYLYIGKPAYDGYKYVVGKEGYFYPMTVQEIFYEDGTWYGFEARFADRYDTVEEALAHAEELNKDDCMVFDLTAFDFAEGDYDAYLANRDALAMYIFDGDQLIESSSFNYFDNLIYQIPQKRGEVSVKVKEPLYTEWGSINGVVVEISWDLTGCYDYLEHEDSASSFHLDTLGMSTLLTQNINDADHYFVTGSKEWNFICSNGVYDWTIHTANNEEYKGKLVVNEVVDILGKELNKPIEMPIPEIEIFVNNDELTVNTDIPCRVTFNGRNNKSFGTSASFTVERSAKYKLSVNTEAGIVVEGWLTFNLEDGTVDHYMYELSSQEEYVPIIVTNGVITAEPTVAPTATPVPEVKEPEITETPVVEEPVEEPEVTETPDNNEFIKHEAPVVTEIPEEPVENEETNSPWLGIIVGCALGVTLIAVIAVRVHNNK